MHATRTVVLPIWPSKLNLPFDIDKLLRAQPLICYDGEKLWRKADEIKRELLIEFRADSHTPAREGSNF
jgi:hypothetical protein